MKKKFFLCEKHSQFFLHMYIYSKKRTIKNAKKKYKRYSECDKMIVSFSHFFRKIYNSTIKI